MDNAQNKADSEVDAPGGNIVEDSGKIVLGAVENVLIGGEEFLAKVDTGADVCSICESLTKKLNLGPPTRSINVRSSSGSQIREIIKVPINLKGKELLTEFNIANRRHMKFPLLIGRNVLEGGFVIDITK
jgi:hypothetical protein